MISALLMTCVLAQTPVYESPVLQKVVETEDAVVLTGFPILRNAICGGTCNVGSSTVVVHEPGLYLTLQNIPGGVEIKREYVRCKIYDKFYTLPVVNGCLPQVTVRSTNDLVLNYGQAIVYDKTVYGGKAYITYNTTGTVARNPEAVKTFEGVETVKKAVTSGPSGVHHPDTLTTPAPVQDKPKVPTEKEIDDLFNIQSTATPTTIGPGGAKRPSDAEVDDLFKRPSSVPDTNRGLPRY